MGSTMVRNQKHLFQLRQSSCETSKGLIKQPSAVLGNLCSRAINSGAGYSGKESCPSLHEEGMGDTANHKSHVFAETVTASSLQGEGLEKLFCLLIVQKALESRDLKISRPLPVLIGYKEVDLLKLSQCVASLGGYKNVTATGLWSQISEVLGFGSACGPGIKLVYVKYLTPLASENLQAKKVVKMFRPIVENVTSKLDKNGHQVSASLERELSETQLQNFLSPFERKKVARIQDLYKLKKISMQNRGRDVDNVFSRKGSRLFKLEKGKLQAVSKTSSSAKRPLTELDHLPLPRKRRCKNNEETVQALRMASGMDIDSLTMEENSTLDKNSYSFDIMDVYNWMKRIALKPGDSSNGQDPEGSKEKDSWADVYRLLTRRLRSCLWTRRPPESNHETDQPYQRNRVLYHSKHYDKFLWSNSAVKGIGQQLPYGTSYFQSRFHGTVRSSRLAADLCVYGYDRTSEVKYDRIPRKRIPIGFDFQAEVPEYCSETVPDSVVETESVHIDPDSGFCDEDESKWFEFLGTQVWPVLGKNRVINEKRIGHGMPDICSCPDSRSTDCFRLHIKHDREMLKLELGTAFFSWGFDRMGESVSEQWTVKEEEIYKSLVALNPASEGKDFWEELPAALPSRELKDFISYYFNVFVLRRRAAQNRRNLKDIDSDDDESECFLF